MLVVLVGLAAVGVGAQRGVDGERDQAVIGKVLSQVKDLRANDSALAAQLAVAAYRLEPGEESRRAVLGMLATPYGTRVAGAGAEAFRLAVSPNGRLLGVAEGNEVRLWDIGDTVRPQARESVSTKFPVYALAFSADGRTLATAGPDRAVLVWDVSGAKPLLRADLPGFGTVESLAFSHDGRLLAAGTEQGSVQVWNVEGTGEPRRGTSATVDGEVRYVAFNGVDHVLAVGRVNAAGAVAELRDADDPGRLLGSLPVTSSEGWVMAFSTDGRAMAEGNVDSGVRLWDVGDRSAPKNVATLTGPVGGVRSLVFSPDRGTLAASGADGNVLLWTITDPARPTVQPPLSGMGANVSGLAYLPDGRTMAVAGDDGSVRLERLADYTFSARTGGIVTSLSFSPDSKTLVAAEDYRRGVELRDVADPWHVWSAPADVGPDARVLLAPRGNLMVISDAGGSTTLWDTTDIRRPASPAPLVPYLSTANGPLAVSGDGRILADVGFGNVGLWDIGNQQAPQMLGGLPPDSEPTTAVALSPTGRLLVRAGAGRITALWDLAKPSSPRLITLLPGLAPGPVRAVAFSPDGRLLAVSSDDNTVHLWDVNDLARPRPVGVLAGHAGPINALAFSPDGRTLATGSGDDTARLWDVHDPHHFDLIATLEGHTGSVTAVAFSPDGRMLATGSSDRSIGLWDTDAEHAVERLCALAWPRISQGDWERYLPGFDYRPPCPE
ncbi:WD40 repeat domain-containing protein [Kutzneria sp. NPDC052558]|uniref:WD40 repeat domain-containing protein n=1 Tax=Kutzneria sp. NPDC052558 TaxID=3364121 RepID=UPI0037C7A2E0